MASMRLMAGCSQGCTRSTPLSGVLHGFEPSGAGSDAPPGQASVTWRAALSVGSALRTVFSSEVRPLRLPRAELHARAE